MKQVLRVSIFIFSLCFLAIGCSQAKKHEATTPAEQIHSADTSVISYDTASIPPGHEREFILYGRELFINTHLYLGPKGTVKQITGNEMDCKNCHIENGTKPFGQPLITASGRYPQYRPREATILTIQDRVNNCLERPLLGKHLEFDSKEMKSFAMYLKWIWDKNKNTMKIKGDIPNTLPWMDRKADWKQGRIDYEKFCARCHGTDGEGIKAPSGYGYTYPPVWGKYGYAMGSSMHRVGKLAAFIYYNMPFDKDITHISVTEEQAYDIAAYINNESVNPRPNFHEEDILYPHIEDKSVDYPIGPYADTFTQDRHKYGPYKPIEEYWKDLKK